MTKKIIRECFKRGFLFAQKSEHSKLIHIWTPLSQKTLCGISEDVYAYFQPFANLNMCKKCLKVFNQD